MQNKLKWSQKSTLFSKSIISLTVASILTGCSALNTNDSVYHKGDYRQTQIKLTKALEVPPNLISPVKTDQHFYTTIGQKNSDTTLSTIPSYTAKGLNIQSNLGQSWLEIKASNSQNVWKNIKRYLMSKGFAIKEANQTTGFIKTNFIPRKQIVPTKEQGALTKLFNSFRTEYATGAFDRITAQIVTDKKTGNIRVYFYDSMIFTSVDAEGDTSMGNSKIKPYSPLVEAQTLYGAMIFLGATSGQALQQIAMAEHKVEIVDGTEFDGIQLKAGLNESWVFFKAMVYRAGWHIVKINEADKIAWVKVPSGARQEEGFISHLAFWQSAKKNAIPKQVIFTLTALKSVKDKSLKSEQSLLKVKSDASNTPLTVKQRYYIFNQLGFIKK